MPEEKQQRSYFIDRAKLPPDYPTHAHAPHFWEELGRTVAAFGFLEEMLSKAIFALTGMKEFDPDGDPDAFAEWITTLEKTITGQLGALIGTYGKALADNNLTKDNDYTGLITGLSMAKDIRNVLCHCSWGIPDDQGQTVPRFVNRKLQVFETPVDTQFLQTTRKAVMGMTCDVLDSVTSLGVQFPGSESPGQQLWPDPRELSKSLGDGTTSTAAPH